MERLGSEAERYLRVVVEGHPIWVRGELQDELRGHLTEAIGRRLAAGADPATAEAEALEAFGPADELRRQLADVHRHRSSATGRLLQAVLLWSASVPVDWLAPLRLVLRRPIGNFGRDYALGRYDAIITRGERELRERGPRFNLHHELGMAYGAIGELDRALEHYQAEVDRLHSYPLPRLLGGSMALATAYSNLAGILERLGRVEDADRAVRAGLDVDGPHGMLHLQRALRLVALGDRDRAIDHLEALLDHKRSHGRERLFLFATQAETFDPIRQDPRFGRLRLRAAAA